jgi:hypothetical protein
MKLKPMVTFGATTESPASWFDGLRAGRRVPPACSPLMVPSKCRRARKEPRNRKRAVRGKVH